MKNIIQNKIVLVSIGLIIVATIYAVGKTKTPTDNNLVTNTGFKKPQVITSFYPLYFFASQIAGDKATIFNVTPAGSEPHDYEPTAQDMARIEDGQLLILNGGQLEPWGEKLKNILQGKQISIITVGEDITNQTVVEDGNKIRDPHIWLDPALAKKEVEIIAKGLSNIDPSNKSYYDNNLLTLESKLDNLDQEFKTGLKNCQKKDIITSHAAFGYLATEYGLNQVPLSGLSPDEEPTIQKLAEVSDFAKKNGIKYIFFESLVSPKLSQTIAQSAGAQTLELNPIEGLSDQQIANGESYFTKMESNLTNLKIALECK